MCFGVTANMRTIIWGKQFVFILVSKSNEILSNFYSCTLISKRLWQYISLIFKRLTKRLKRGVLHILKRQITPT